VTGKPDDEPEDKVSEAPVSGLRLGTMKPRRVVRVTIDLDPTVAELLDRLARNLGKSRDETVADGLRALVAASPRSEDDAEP
jgi:hypothetical protein